MSLSDEIHRHAEWLRRQWMERLYEDYRHICFTYRLKELKRPVIQVTPIESHWGLWDPLTRTLTIAQRLIENHSWDVVIEILKHEMAHQIVSEIFLVEEAHGPHFKRACLMLGVSSWASRAETDLAHPIRTGVQPEPEAAEERLLKRVEKLLALATSTNEHEALLAMQKVQELYTKYNLDRVREKRRGEHVYLLIRTRNKRMERYQYLICSILNEHFFVQVIHTSLFDATDLCEYKAVELLGTAENVLMAEYVYHFLVNQVRSLWNHYRKVKGKGARSRSSYSLGVLSGFRDKLDRHRDETKARAEASSKAEGRPESTTALVAIATKELEEFVSFRYPRLTRIKGGSSLRDSHSFEAGRKAGLSLVLHKGIKNEEGNRGKLLKR